MLAFEHTNGVLAVRANLSENPKSKLSDKEILAQLTYVTEVDCLIFLLLMAIP